MIPLRDALFLLIAFAEIAIDFSYPHTVSCIKHKGLHVFLVLLFHHLFSTFLMYGWMLPNKKLLVLFIIGNALMLIEWFKYRKNHITMEINNQCGWKSDTPLRDIMWWLGFKDIHIGNITLHVLLAIIFLILGIYFYRS